MVVFRGRSTRAAVLFSLCALIGVAPMPFLIYALVKGPKHKSLWPKEAVLYYDTIVTAFWIVVPIVLAFLLLYSLAMLFVARRFATNDSQLTITNERLHFPVLPGIKKGRSFAWTDVDLVSKLTVDSCPKKFRLSLRLLRFVFGNPLILKIDIKQPQKKTCKRGLIVDFFYWIDQLITQQFFGKKSILECVLKGTFSHQQVFQAIKALADDPTLRARYGGDDATYAISSSSGDKVHFELD